MTPEFVLILALAGNVIMFWLAPALSRPGLYFGVTVRPDFRDTDFARASLRRYRMVIACTGMAAMAIVATMSLERSRAIALLVHTAVAVLAWGLTRQSMLPHAWRGTPVRSASVSPRDTRIPGGALALAGPFLIVAAAALFAYVQWDAIPEEFQSMRRGSGGRLTTKSAGTVFFPFVFTTALLAAFTIQTSFLVKRTRQMSISGPAAEAEKRFKRRTAVQSLAAAYILSVGSSWLAIQRLLGGGQSSGIAETVWVGVIMIFAVGFTIWAVRVGQGGQRQIPVSADTLAGDATPDSAWKGGLVYFNPSDPAVFVEVRMGFGWTLNFGNVWSWIVLAMALGVPLLVIRLLN